jgi:hypothetical protein
LLWAACFAACDVVAIAVGQPLRLYLPIALMVRLATVRAGWHGTTVPVSGARERLVGRVLLPIAAVLVFVRYPPGWPIG